jgi:hypothetical protein
MPRAALLLCVASLAPPAARCAGAASASQTVMRVDGEVRALAFSRDALVVAPGGREIVVQQGPQPRAGLASCRAEILTHRARVRAGKVALSLHCPAGCSVVISGRLLAGTARECSFEPGMHVVRLPVRLGRSHCARRAPRRVRRPRPDPEHDRQGSSLTGRSARRTSCPATHRISSEKPISSTR